MANIKSLFLLLSLSLPCWPSGPLVLQEVPHENPFSASLFGHCRVLHSTKTPGAKEINLTFKNPQSFHHPFKLKGKLHRNSTTRNLVFIIPGIFEHSGGDNCNLLASLSFQAGNHVIQLPNFLGRDYLRANPAHPSGHIPSAAANYIAIIKFVLHTLKKKNIPIGKVRIIGVSLGAFTLPVVASLDHDHIISHMLLLSPIYDLDHSIKVTDLMIDDIREELSKSRPLGDYATLFRVCWSNNDDNFNQDDFHNFKRITVYHSFLKPITEMLKNMGKRPKPLPYTISFRSALYGLSSEAKNFIDAETSSILYWLDQIPNDRLQIKIITAKNDFLVQQPSVWANVEARGVQVIKLNRGGHVGYRASPNFREFIIQTMRPNLQE